MAQRQLVLLRGDKVLYRFREGNNFHTKLTGQKNEHWGFLVGINEFSVITSQDTIELKKIRKVLLPGKRSAYKLGNTLITVGVGLFVIDQFNSTLIQHGKPRLDPGVTKTSVVITSVGLPMLLLKKNWRKISRRVKMKSVGRDSRLYLVD